jgi:hypothetical protein
VGLRGRVGRRPRSRGEPSPSTGSVWRKLPIRIRCGLAISSALAAGTSALATPGSNTISGLEHSREGERHTSDLPRSVRVDSADHLEPRQTEHDAGDRAARDRPAKQRTVTTQSPTDECTFL